MGESGLQSNVEMKESMKGKVTAEGMKLLPARFGGFVEEIVVVEEEEEAEKEDGNEEKGRKKKKKKKKKRMLFQEVKDLVRVLRTISLASKQKGRNI